MSWTVNWINLANTFNSITSWNGFFKIGGENGDIKIYSNYLLSYLSPNTPISKITLYDLKKSTVGSDTFTKVHEI